MKSEVICREECYAIMGACFEVYSNLGSGFLESVYSEALSIELALRSIPFEKEAAIAVHYRNRALQQTYFADFICCGSVLLELKAVDSIADAHQAQVLNYLSATNLKVGLLINFGHYPGLEWKRLANTKHPRQEAKI